VKEYIKGANPYMPLWEHVPDAEPRVFEYNGEKRVYVYGSHDSMRNEYCGREYVSWSAPVDDLTNWTCHGICYVATDNSIMYAPDVVQKGDTFYMYAAEQRNSRIMVAKSKNPAGPFTDPVRAEVGCDVGVLVDDDGSVYAYWGFCECYAAQLNDDMATIKEGTLRKHMIPHCYADFDFMKLETEHIGPEGGFFEAASPRKINGKYVFLYSHCYNKDMPEYGAGTNCASFLSYCYSDSPLDGFVFGGDVSYNGGEIIPGENGHNMRTFRQGNNHGGLMEINGQWYIFYHRHTGPRDHARQAMLEPVDVAMDKNGRIFIGDITYENGEPVSSKCVPMTSQGPQVNGLDAYKIISAGYACHISGAADDTIIDTVYEESDSASTPIINIVNGTTAGFRYLQFGLNSAKTVTVKADALADIKVNVRIDNYKGKVIATLDMAKGATEATANITSGTVGKHAIYFEFVSEAEGAIANFDYFTFD